MVNAEGCLQFLNGDRVVTLGRTREERASLQPDDIPCTGQNILLFPRYVNPFPTHRTYPFLYYSEKVSD